MMPFFIQIMSTGNQTNFECYSLNLNAIMKSFFLDSQLLNTVSATMNWNLFLTLSIAVNEYFLLSKITDIQRLVEDGRV